MIYRDPQASGLRRQLARTDAAFARAAERLARLSPGGAPDHPIEVASASQIEVHAEGMLCPFCHGPQVVDDHVAETVNQRRLRIAFTRCKHCDARRAVYFRIGSALPS